MDFLKYPGEEFTMNGSGRGANNRGKSFKRRERDSERRRGQPRPSQETEHKELRPGTSRKAQDAILYGSQKGRRANSSDNEAGRDSKRSEGKLGSLFQDRRNEKNHSFFERLKWTPPQLSAEPIPEPDCPYCGKPIKDISTAIADKNSGEPVHFDCVAARIAEGETLESGDAIAYIGGGRFGVVHFPGIIREETVQGRRSNNGYDTRNFRIKKILEWENKENRAPWRKDIGDHFSVV
jgi:hypothetical protein